MKNKTEYPNMDLSGLNQKFTRRWSMLFDDEKQILFMCADNNQKKLSDIMLFQINRITMEELLNRLKNGSK